MTSTAFRAIRTRVVNSPDSRPGTTRLMGIRGRSTRSAMEGLGRLYRQPRYRALPSFNSPVFFDVSPEAIASTG
jgi:hypothetical protein